MKASSTMKLTAALAVLCLSGASAFQPQAAFVRKTSSLNMGTQGMDLSGNPWKPDSEKMGSTDTGDYFPEGYDPNEQVAFTEGWQGSQTLLNQDNDGPQLPGMENLGADAVMMGGIEVASEIPAGMQFIPSSVPDGEYATNVAASSSGAEMEIEVKPTCMTFEDYFAGFSPNSHPSLSVSPVTGRMDRRGGESTYLKVKCEPNGQAGNFEGDLVINLPEDNSKICYKIRVTSF